MPLTLVTGPANAGKAQVVLDEVRARAAHDPILVVPTARDADAYRRELAASGAVFGPRVATFDGLAREIARRVGLRAGRLGGAQRDALVSAAISRAPLRALAAPARTPGFAAAAGGLIAELQREMVEPRALAAALDARAREAGGRDAVAGEMCAVYSEYRALLDRLGRVDGELAAWRALDGLRAAPARWGTTPVFLYGFDDLTGLERDAVETLSRLEGVDVTVALTWEDRVALAGRARAFQELAPLATDHVGLSANSSYYAPDARAALHHLERGLFEPGAGVVEPGGAVRLLEAGGERAEAELVAAEVLACLRAGTPPEEIAIVQRSPAGAAPLVREVLDGYGVPVAVEAPLPFAATPLGRGLLALLRCAAGQGDAGDLLTYLRTPGLLDRPELADDLEARLRRAGASDARTARALWEERRWSLEAVDRLQSAAAATGAASRERAGAASPGRLHRAAAALPERVARELELLFAAPRRRAAAQLDAAEGDDALALAAADRALRGLAELAREDPRLAGDLDSVAAGLEGVDVRPAPAPGHVRVVDPLALRARRVRALFACGLQEGEFPRPGRADPFLPDERRRELALAGGPRLRQREADALADERALFYACASRPEKLLALSWRTCDEEGRPAVRSFFVDDVRDLFGPSLDASRRERPLGEVTGAPGAAPTPRERARAVAAARAGATPEGIRPLRAPAVLEELGARPAWSAGQLERHAGCPVRWLVESYLMPDSLEPDPEPLARGNAAHSLLEATLRRLRDETGSARLDADSLPRARELLADELERQRDDLALSPVPARRRSALRRLEADLQRYLRKAADQASPLEPAHFELSFGGRDDEAGPLGLEGVAVRGRIDRIDVEPGGARAAVYDYKGATGHPVAKWAPDGRLQVALYMLAARDVLGLDPVAGLYQPLAGEQRARGAVREDCELAPCAVATDRLSPEELDAELSAAARRAEEVARELTGGNLEPRPRTCGWDGGCQYPGVCRCEP